MFWIAKNHFLGFGLGEERRCTAHAIYRGHYWRTLPIVALIRFKRQRVASRERLGAMSYETTAESFEVIRCSRIDSIRGNGNQRCAKRLINVY